MFLQTHNRAPIETRKQPNFEGTLKNVAPDWNFLPTQKETRNDRKFETRVKFVCTLDF